MRCQHHRWKMSLHYHHTGPSMTAFAIVARIWIDLTSECKLVNQEIFLANGEQFRNNRSDAFFCRVPNAVYACSPKGKVGLSPTLTHMHRGQSEQRCSGLLAVHDFYTSPAPQQPTCTRRNSNCATDHVNKNVMKPLSWCRMVSPKSPDTQERWLCVRRQE